MVRTSAKQLFHPRGVPALSRTALSLVHIILFKGPVARQFMATNPSAIVNNDSNPLLNRNFLFECIIFFPYKRFPPVDF
jgi:hypothetical protein